MFKGRIPLKGAPYWYNTPLDQLDFEWSIDEQLLIDRFCEKILKNIAEEGGMTPLERWNATVYGKDKDRMMLSLATMTPIISRVLDSYADAIKPISLYQHPKLLVLAELAMYARYGLDYINTHNINYGEDMWGGTSKMIEYGQPILEGKPPIKSLEDLEGMPIPDPYKDGMYPGFLWINREMTKIIKEHNLPIPFWTSICPGQPLLVMMGMMGWTEFSIGLRKNPELVGRCNKIAEEFLTGFGKAVIDVAQPIGIKM